MQHPGLSSTRLMVAVLAAIIVGGAAMHLGSSSGTLTTVEWLTGWFLTFFGSVTGVALITEYTKNKELRTRQLIRKKELLLIAKKYNDVTDLLENQYQLEKDAVGLFGGHQKEQLRQRYERLYYQNKAAYVQECRQLKEQQQPDTPFTRRFMTFWKNFITIGVVAQIAACSYTTGTADRLQAAATPQKPVVSTTADSNSEETIVWSAETVPMPHLTNGNRYVSNPDQVVSSQTVQTLDGILKRMDDSLHIESAMVIVNHVENQDVFRMAQDLFDRYHIGKDDRGLVIVLAYGDHQVRTHTGRALEADLTDIECSRLQQTYAVPFMKAELPDSGMIYLATALYNTLQGKDLPVSDHQRWEAEADSANDYAALYIFLFAFWALLAYFLYRRYNGTSSRHLLRSNPFEKATPVFIIGGGGFGGGRGGGFGGGFGGGGFSGGGFSGGSSGGGGATSSW